jgi:hypothetical protein
MRLSTCIAASFALLTVAVAPLTAHAQVQSRPRSLTPQETTFVSIFNQLMSDKPNRLVQFVTEWGKADDGQMVCAALGVGKSVEEIHQATLERSVTLPDPSLHQEFREYSNGIIVVAASSLCPQFSGALDQYLESQQ